MASNIIVKLLLDNGDFSNKLGHAKKSFDSSMSGMLAAAGKLAAGLLAVKSAADVFNRVVGATETTGDAWASMMNTCKTSVDQFFKSLSTGDFSYFDQGMSTIIGKAQEAYDAYDKLGNVLMSFDFTKFGLMLELDRAMTTVKDKTLSRDERSAALTRAQEIIAQMQEGAEVLYESTIAAVKTKIASGSVLRPEDIPLDRVEHIIGLDALREGDDLRSEYSGQYAEYQKKVAELNRRAYTTEAVTAGVGAGKYTRYEKTLSDFGRSEEYSNSLKTLQKTYLDGILYNELLVKYTDEELRELGQQLSSVARERSTIEKQAQQINRPKKELFGGFTETAGAGSLSALDAEMKELQKQLAAATTAGARDGFRAAIEELEAKKVLIAAEIHSDLSPGHRSGYGYSEQQFFVNKKENDLNLPASLSTSLLAVNGYYENFVRAQRRAIEDGNAARQTFSELSGVFYSLSGALGDSAAGWLQWAAQVVSACEAVTAASMAINAGTGGPLGLFGAGVGLLGTLFGGIPGFAEGGVVTRPTLGVFGEAGPEAVIPLDKLNRIINRGGGEVQFKIRGQDLYGALHNYNSYRGRMTP